MATTHACKLLFDGEAPCIQYSNFTSASVLCHGSRYNRDGKVVRAVPAPLSLLVLAQTEIRPDRVLLKQWDKNLVNWKR